MKIDKRVTTLFFCQCSTILVIGLLDYWIIGLLDYWIIGLLDYWVIGLLDYGKEASCPLLLEYSGKNIWMRDRGNSSRKSVWEVYSKRSIRRRFIMKLVVSRWDNYLGTGFELFR